MKLAGITKRFGDKVIFENFDLEIEEGKITAVLGASGIGKTTLLNILSDNIAYDGKIEGTPKSVSYLFQEKRLLPHLTVEENLDFVLKTMIPEKGMRRKKIADMLKRVGLSGSEKQFPNALSGGMGQRLAMARAFVFDAELLLMDEPFKELDITLKKKMLELFRALYSEAPRTTVFVTHDLDDALRLSDRIVVLGEKGKFLCDKTIPSVASEEEISRLRTEIYVLL